MPEELSMKRRTLTEILYCRYVYVFKSNLKWKCELPTSLMSVSLENYKRKLCGYGNYRCIVGISL